MSNVCTTFSWFLSPPPQNIILEPTAYDRLHVGDEITLVWPLPVAKPHFLITKSKSKSSLSPPLDRSIFLSGDFHLGARRTVVREESSRYFSPSLPPSYILIPYRGILQLCNSNRIYQLKEGLSCGCPLSDGTKFNAI